MKALFAAILAVNPADSRFSADTRYGDAGNQSGRIHPIGAVFGEYMD